MIYTWEIVKYNNKEDKRIFKVIETWLNWTWHENGPAVTIQCLNCDLNKEDNDWIYDDLEEDLIKVKNCIKDIIIKEVEEKDLNIINDPDDLLQFSFFNKISLVDNSLNLSSFYWTLICNINAFNENNQKNAFIIALDVYFDSKEDRIKSKKYYNIDWDDFDDFDSALKKYKLFEPLTSEDIKQIEKDNDKINDKIQQIILKVLNLFY